MGKLISIVIHPSFLFSYEEKKPPAENVFFFFGGGGVERGGGVVGREGGVGTLGCVFLENKLGWGGGGGGGEAGVLIWNGGGGGGGVMIIRAVMTVNGVRYPIYSWPAASPLS